MLGSFFVRDTPGIPAAQDSTLSCPSCYDIIGVSILASSGQVDMYTLQKLLTHKSPLMTQRYAHLRDEALKRASDLAGEIIGKVAMDDQENSA